MPVHGAVCIGAPSTIRTPILSFCLNRIRWHLTGLSEMSLTRLLLLHFSASFPFSFLQNSHIYVHFILLLWANLCTKYHVRACCCRASTVPGIAAPQAPHNTSQTARTKPQRKYVPIRERQRKQADRVEERTCCRAFIQHAEVSKRTKKWQSSYSKKTYNYSHIAGVMLEGFAFSFDPITMQHCSFSPYLTSLSYMRAASGLLSWSREPLPFLQVLSLHSKSWTSLSASFAFYSIRPCERAWRAVKATRGAKRLV